MLSVVKYLLTAVTLYLHPSVNLCVSQQLEICWLCPRHLSDSLVTAVTHPTWKKMEAKKKKRKEEDLTISRGKTHKHAGVKERHAHIILYLPVSRDELFCGNFVQIKNVKLTFDQACLHFLAKQGKKY